MLQPHPCPHCLNGERVIETPTAIGLYRETVPCDQCAEGLALAAFLTARTEAFWATRPVLNPTPTPEQLNEER